MAYAKIALGSLFTITVTDDDSKGEDECPEVASNFTLYETVAGALVLFLEKYLVIAPPLDPDEVYPVDPDASLIKEASLELSENCQLRACPKPDPIPLVVSVNVTLCPSTETSLSVVS